MHLGKISIFSLNDVIVRPTKIMNRANKNWALFLENKNQKIQKNSFIKVDLLVKYSSQKKKSERCRKMTLKVQILETLRRLFIILVGLTMT